MNPINCPEHIHMNTFVIQNSFAKLQLMHYWHHLENLSYSSNAERTFSVHCQQPLGLLKEAHSRWKTGTEATQRNYSPKPFDIHIDHC